ncbi:MAG: ATPase [Bacteroides sp.]|nr:ATPase [Bacteroides sp.]
MKTIEVINRPIYMSRIHPYIEKDIIKILTRQQMVGKSYILNPRN